MISRYSSNREEKIRNLLLDRVIEISEKKHLTIKELVELSLFVKLLFDVGNFCCSIYLSRTENQSADAVVMRRLSGQQSKENSIEKYAE